ncbi:unnamed protein product [Vitrella brassicaformis CCMP3155]|uniref:Cyclic nucleotide-binding domain-containing protein n=1 Tax=Vitrella brassicaformis (strain CCMP3155) TaxID=1169540 RepID=A0A0G4ELF6_VITBC|nr:unnamed protein product [Vitrella brassicaformis CCMP3155]|mmetsp:Transcript_45789/g.113794  ORF Transcript_45789/g.113794 Transcript_45789/m.113794 type:complete len:370 (-) Transcript_45789:486-1595(-)|eukprot:CEL97648.1 unnamed protein product [Vitrella brassicaformis CCMP3155]
MGNVLRKGDSSVVDEKRGSGDASPAAAPPPVIGISVTPASPKNQNNAVDALPDRYFKRNRRVSVSAESVNPNDYVKVVHQKAEDTKVRLRLILKDCNKVLFSELSDDKLEEIVDAMFRVDVKEGETIIKQGDAGDNFYVIDEGEFDIFVARDSSPPVKVGTVGPGRSFGELALMYMCPRAATVTATKDSVCWALNRYSFQHLMVAGEAKRFNEYEAFLESVAVFASLNKYERIQLSDALVPNAYEEGEEIITQGDEDGHELYIMEEGTAAAFLSRDGTEVKVKEYSRGDYFGELALIADKPRAATVRATSDCSCLSINREDFVRLLGPIQDILQRNADLYVKYEDAIKAQNLKEASQPLAAEDEADDSP